MDQLKKLGFTIAAPSLIVEESSVSKSDAKYDSSQIGRVGLRKSASEVLDEQLAKGSIMCGPSDWKPSRVSPHAEEPKEEDPKIKAAIKKEADAKIKADDEFRRRNSKEAGSENLKDTHGEQFHADAEKPDTEIEEVDREEDGEVARPARKRSEYAQGFNGNGHANGTKDYTYVSKSTLEKALDALAPKKAPVKKKADLVEWAKEEEKEHDMDKKSCAPVKKSAHEALADLAKGFHNKPPSSKPTKNAPHMAKDPEDKRMEHKQLKDAGLLKKKSYVQKSGPGGLIMDFGSFGHNNIADQTNALLARNSDNVQVATVKYQKQEMDKALHEYVEKGEEAFNRGKADATDDGSMHSSWNRQFSQTTDQQITKLAKQGQLEDTQPSVPRNEPVFKAQPTLKVGNEVVKAMSPTDAAVLELERGMMEQMQGDGAFELEVGPRKVTIDI